ncbi:uncharacterized protein (TIGR03083 family) [Agrococcus sp. UYP10]|uniref:maleylpyruvate isomerase family mycothiol-dependent enzyme n=1 Tax=Agrococcus sp. UYP10 TaxID=1756355 RepID=UPI003390CCB5
MRAWSKQELLIAIAAERAALAEQLAEVDEVQWATPSLCAGWTVEHVVAHLTAAASIGPLRWLRSMSGARFDDAVHNQRRLEEHLGPTPSGTLERFRAVVDSRTAASGHWPAWLGEVIVHGQDIRIPLGLPTPTPPDRAAQVAAFFAARDFAVASRSAVRGLRVEASDAELGVGDGPLVRGPAVALVVSMAGRSAMLDRLEGDGAAMLAERIAAPREPRP